MWGSWVALQEQAWHSHNGSHMAQQHVCLTGNKQWETYFQCVLHTGYLPPEVTYITRTYNYYVCTMYAQVVHETT